MGRIPLKANLPARRSEVWMGVAWLVVMEPLGAVVVSSKRGNDIELIPKVKMSGPAQVDPSGFPSPWYSGGGSRGQGFGK